MQRKKVKKLVIPMRIEFLALVSVGFLIGALLS